MDVANLNEHSLISDRTYDTTYERTLMHGMTPEFDTFLSAHRWAVLTCLRRSGSPVNSVVAYAREGNDFVVSTPGATFKRAAIGRDPRVNLCAISNSEPFNFVALEGAAHIQVDDIAEPTRRVFAAIEDTGWKIPDPLDDWLIAQSRVILRIKPERISGVIR